MDWLCLFLVPGHSVCALGVFLHDVLILVSQSLLRVLDASQNQICRIKGVQALRSLEEFGYDLIVLCALLYENTACGHITIARSSDQVDYSAKRDKSVIFNWIFFIWIYAFSSTQINWITSAIWSFRSTPLNTIYLEGNPLARDNQYSNRVLATLSGYVADYVHIFMLLLNSSSNSNSSSLSITQLDALPISNPLIARLLRGKVEATPTGAPTSAPANKWDACYHWCGFVSAKK